MQSKHKQTNCKHSRRITAFSEGITILNQRIFKKDDIEFVTEFLCLYKNKQQIKRLEFMSFVFMMNLLSPVFLGKILK